MNADDNPRFAKDPSLYFAFNQKLNIADSYCVFDDRQVAVVGEEMVKYGRCRARCAA